MINVIKDSAKHNNLVFLKYLCFTVIDEKLMDN